MNIEEVIKKLEEIKQIEGNIPCVTQDGLDPSDWDVITEIKVSLPPLTTGITGKSAMFFAW